MLYFSLAVPPPNSTHGKLHRDDKGNTYTVFVSADVLKAIKIEAPLDNIIENVELKEEPKDSEESEITNDIVNEDAVSYTHLTLPTKA